MPCAQADASVAVVGSGIVGLNTAAALSDEGHRVVVLEAERSADTVSAVAGGLWSPFRAGPPRDVQRWSRIGYDAYSRMSKAQPNSGVRMVDVRLAVSDDAVPHPWEHDAPVGAGRAATTTERPFGVDNARIMRVPHVDTALHLAWLRERLTSGGTTFLRVRLERLEEAFAFSPTVVACPGLAARELLGDPHLEAIRGVVVEVALAEAGQMSAVLDDRGAQPTYVLPRGDTVLLGGRADVGDERLTTTAEEVSDIVARCCRLVPELAGAPVLGCRIGLRPARPTVRLVALPQRHGRELIVNYGHGGSGWTLAAGCAQDVAALLAERPTR